MNNIFVSADILLPDFSKTDGTKWSVIACDQYTSEPEYWEQTEKLVGENPSTLRLTLPEVYLDESESRIPQINENMRQYLKDILISHPDSMIYLERKQSDGRIRHGIIGAIDLEEYDYNKGATSLIRATEGTVLSRIPPRVKIRRDAMLELPHVLLLIDDKKRTVIEKITARKQSFEMAYDFELMQEGGHVCGWFIDKQGKTEISKGLSDLAKQSNCDKEDCSPLLFAVGDGNHSLATAKEAYEEIKQKIGAQEAKNHPSRYALAEVVNIHDESLDFEPIYRVVFGADFDDMMREMKKYSDSLYGSEAAQIIQVYREGKMEEFVFEHPKAQLSVGTLQSFLDLYSEKHPEITIDYIHGEESLKKLSSKDGAVGFIFKGMQKSDLFRSVMLDGALPRKTFSMGHADDKRFYLECRKIK